MLSLIGFATLLTIVILLVTGRVAPIVGLVLIPIIGAFAAGFGVTDIGGFFEEGIQSVINVVVMFIFAILYFGIMQDAGLFDPLIRRMIALTSGNVVSIAVGTVIIAAVAHLDGSGASTFLITIPALLPLYRRLQMSPYLLLLLVGASASVVNMFPWAGPLGRTSAVLNINPTELWKPLIPIQITGLLLVIVLAIFLGVREKRRIAKLQSTPTTEYHDSEETATDEKKDESLARPKLLWFNLLLTLGVIAALVEGTIPAEYTFMIGVSIALIVNYPKVSDQMARIRAHASSALLMASIILAAGSFLGILKGSGMLDSIATDLVTILPAFIAPILHVIIGIFGVPFDLILSTDAYYFALLPVVEQIASSHGIAATSTAYAMIVGNIIGTFVSPLAPAVWLAIGLAKVEMGGHIRYSFPWMWGLSIVLMAFAFLFGIITL
ncbi:CitMHS family transporter [Desmospora activa]|uniref:CitMHS family citrate-Mg2+:H+ or citrate-Ca2+:H+ symporter n=1 Tax=Desmospora activa DSM 45169 TaxID=1121389 RepID=A0A2T4ZAU2_9BACL|nr:citrate:proton symporter [Desmospora activa]PTM58996.1 CitMHS family citrate-Mg2+:H+ or citrate-Ca2+:H+ symporter [Desmospora activa DSM 45169]